jgi:hypothetical protein
LSEERVLSGAALPDSSPSCTIDRGIPVLSAVVHGVGLARRRRGCGWTLKKSFGWVIAALIASRRTSEGGRDLSSRRAAVRIARSPSPSPASPIDSLALRPEGLRASAPPPDLAESLAHNPFDSITGPLGDVVPEGARHRSDP